MTEEEKKAKIELHSGRALDILNPDPEIINIDDIAYGLSRQSRFAGQCFRYYSVAEHSILTLSLARGYLGLASLTEGEQRAALMHDAHEAYIGDLPSPLKRHFPDYQEIAISLDKAIEKRFSLQDLSTKPIKELDMTALSIEAWRLMPAKKENWTSPISSQYKGIELEPIELSYGAIYNPNIEYGPKESYQMFLAEAKALGLE